MQQRQLRLGDILDDYCPRERRVTNHAIVAMIGDDVKQTRCTTCDADHEYKHAKVPRQRRKSETPAALYSQVAQNAPKRVSHEGAPSNGSSHAKQADAAPEIVETTTVVDATIVEIIEEDVTQPEPLAVSDAAVGAEQDEDLTDVEDEEGDVNGNRAEEGPVHRPLIRASLPRPDGQQPPPRPIPEFTIRQPTGRPNRFRPRHQGGGARRGGNPQFQGNRSNGNVAGNSRGMRPGGGRPPHGQHGAGAPARLARRNGPGRKRSK